MKRIVIAITLSASMTGAYAAQPGEGDCASEFIYEFTGIQSCTSSGKCTARTTSTIALVGVLSCGAPWGQLFRVCFNSGECIDGKSSERFTADGDYFYTSILQNPKTLGAYPKKFAAVMSRSPFGNFPDQVVLFVAGKVPSTELLFGEVGAASFVPKSTGNLTTEKMKRFLARPKLAPNFKE
jgi:hypothetical protein